MKIAYVLSRFPVVSETFVSNQIQGVLELGHDVDVIAGVPATLTPVPHELGAQAGRLRIFHHATPDGVGQRVARGVTRALSLVWRRPLLVARALGLRYHVLGPSFTVLQAAEAVLDAGEPLPRRYDAIVAHFGPNGLVATALVELGLLQGPVVTIFHGYDVTSIPKKFGVGFYQHLFRRGDLFLPISDLWRGRLVEWGSPPERTRVHHVGIDCDRFRPREHDPAVDGAPLRLLSVARLVEKKGIEFALDAMARLVRQSVEVRYRIVGDGPMMTHLRKRSSELGLDDYVEFLGRQPHAVVERELAATDLLLAPSVTAADGDMEGIPVSLMEAMAMSIPVVTTRHSGITELVEDGVSGYLANEGDAASLTDALKRATSERSQWPHIGKRAREKVTRDFNARVQDATLVDLLSGLSSRN